MRRYNLNGSWKYVKDPHNNLTYSTAIKQLSGKKPATMKIPSNWELSGLHNYSGSVWFQRIFNVNTKKNKELISIIEFSGVDYFTDVWLNGKYVGNHEGYFQKFIFNITEQLNYNGSNEIVVKVGSPHEKPGDVWPLRKKLIKGIFNHHDCRPGGWSYEFGQDQNTGGIWNDIKLIINKNVFITDVKITPKLMNEVDIAKIKVDLKYFTNLSEPINKDIEIECIAPDGKISKEIFQHLLIPGQSELSYTFEIKRPKLWWSWELGKPNLYKLKTSIRQSANCETGFGIRTVKLDEKSKFYLNGKEVFLRGTNIIPTQFLSELSADRISKIVRLLREANINIVRVHAHVNRKELYEEFDRNGILIWQDFSLQWTYDDSKEFITNASTQIKEMVKQFYNHPSIAFWCCHNEPGDQIYTLDPFLRDAVLSEDQTRIVRTASNYEEHPYDGWYWGSKEHFAATPMGPLVTEFGAQAIPNRKSLEKFIPPEKLHPIDFKHWNYHNFQPDTTLNIAKVSTGDCIDDFIKNSQNYQAELIKTAIHFYRREKGKSITGIFQFMFIDCWPSITWSVVDYYFKKKKGFRILKESYNPTLLSVNLRQNQYFPKANLNFDFTIINDLHKEINNSQLNILIDGKRVSSIPKLNITGNSSLFMHFEQIKVKIPASVKTGHHLLQFDLTRSGKKVSSDRFYIKISDPPGVNYEN